MSAFRTRSAIPTRPCRFVVAFAALALISLGCRSQNSGDRQQTAPGTPMASFSQDVTTGAPSLVVQFTSTSTGDITSHAWNFGNGTTSTAPNPQATYDTAGSYTVSLTVSGPLGSSTRSMPNLIGVANPPSTGFSCTPDIGFAPHMITCIDQSTGADSVTWTYGDGTPETSDTSHTYASAGSFTVTQIVSNAGLAMPLTETATIDVRPLVINPMTMSGTSQPGDFLFSADTGGASGEIETWLVDGVPVASGNNVLIPLRRPGTFNIEFFFGSQMLGLSGQTSIAYEVLDGPPLAAFTPSVSEAAGPLDVVLNDESTGNITKWEWEFGDGMTCVYPAPPGAPPGSPSVCDSSSPSHTYDTVDRYDVKLTVTEEIDGAPDRTDTMEMLNAVTVTILDPSFEDQDLASEIAAGWTSIRPGGPIPIADHVALSTAQAGGADAGMPTDGQKWAALDGLGTDGMTAVDMVENGIRQVFLRPTTDTVLEFDYVLLYSEPPGVGALDAFTATVSDGASTPVEMTSAAADTLTPYVGPSTRYPTLDGSTTRVTPVRTASLDLAAAPLSAAAGAPLTLTIRITNETNELRSPRAYVDNVRFSAPAAAFTTTFSVPAGPFVAGQPIDFSDDTCLGTAPDLMPAGCIDPTSWRWDFDFDPVRSPTPPSATGSGEQDPTYTFAVAGDYDVMLLARNGDQESSSSMLISVLDAPSASFDVMVDKGMGMGLEPYDPMAPPSIMAMDTIVFSDTSTSDMSLPDPIVAWSWDFGGFGTSSMQNPTTPPISLAGDHVIRLTVTTSEDLMDTFQMVLTVVP